MLGEGERVSKECAHLVITTNIIMTIINGYARERDRQTETEADREGATETDRESNTATRRTS